MLNFFRSLFATDGFMPHGHCYLWLPELVWLHVISDALIALAYMSIPFTLVYFLRKRRDVPFDWLFGCFAIFIVSCGLTHWLEIWTLWTPSYRLSGVVKAFTAFVSVATAILLVRTIPRALRIPSPEKYRKALLDLEQTEAGLRLANQELEAFSYSVAHDLRAPIRGIDGFTSILLQDAALSPDVIANLTRIKENADRMTALIEALLALSKTSRAEIRRTPVDVSELARTIAEELASADHPVEVVIEPGIVVEMDAALGRVMFENLLGNAFKYSAKTIAPRIEVGRTKDGDRPAFFVRDNGAGFDPAFKEKLFRPFERLHPSREFGGSGVGLATVERIVQRHGGAIWAEGEVGRGATFYVHLPE